jgi:hypothetical protein
MYSWEWITVIPDMVYIRTGLDWFFFGFGRFGFSSNLDLWSFFRFGRFGFSSVLDKWSLDLDIWLFFGFGSGFSSIWIWFFFEFRSGFQGFGLPVCHRTGFFYPQFFISLLMVSLGLLDFGVFPVW